MGREEPSFGEGSSLPKPLPPPRTSLHGSRRPVFNRVGGAMQGSFCLCLVAVFHLLLFVNLTKSSHQASATAALFQSSAPPKTTRTFPQDPRQWHSEFWFAVLYGGGLAGKFWEGQGGLEGRGPSAKEGSLRLQGLSHPLNTNPILNFRSFSIFLETLSASSTVRVRSEARRVTRSATDFLPSPT